MNGKRYFIFSCIMIFILAICGCSDVNEGEELIRSSPSSPSINSESSEISLSSGSSEHLEYSFPNMIPIEASMLSEAPFLPPSPLLPPPEGKKFLWRKESPNGQHFDAYSEYDRNNEPKITLYFDDIPFWTADCPGWASEGDLSYAFDWISEDEILLNGSSYDFHTGEIILERGSYIFHTKDRAINAVPFPTLQDREIDSFSVSVNPQCNSKVVYWFSSGYNKGDGNVSLFLFNAETLKWKEIGHVLQGGFFGTWIDEDTFSYAMSEIDPDSEKRKEEVLFIYRVSQGISEEITQFPSRYFWRFYNQKCCIQDDNSISFYDPFTGDMVYRFVKEGWTKLNLQTEDIVLLEERKDFITARNVLDNGLIYIYDITKDKEYIWDSKKINRDLGLDENTQWVNLGYDWELDSMTIHRDPYGRYAPYQFILP